MLPRVNPDGTSLRYALYRLLVQGFRRVQGMWSANPPLNRMFPSRRHFYHGAPQFFINGLPTEKPLGHRRVVDSSTGSFYWVGAGGIALKEANGNAVWDTEAMWDVQM